MIKPVKMTDWQKKIQEQKCNLELLHVVGLCTFRVTSRNWSKKSQIIYFCIIGCTCISDCYLTQTMRRLLLFNLNQKHLILIDFTPFVTDSLKILGEYAQHEYLMMLQKSIKIGPNLLWRDWIEFLSWQKMTTFSVFLQSLLFFSCSADMDIKLMMISVPKLLMTWASNQPLKPL